MIYAEVRRPGCLTGNDKFNGQYLVNIWSVSGQYLVNIWSIFGQYLVNIQSVFGQYLVRLWDDALCAFTQKVAHSVCPLHRCIPPTCSKQGQLQVPVFFRSSSSLPLSFSLLPLIQIRSAANGKGTGRAPPLPFCHS